MRKLEIIERISLDGVIRVSDDDGHFPHRKGGDRPRWRPGVRR
jgi:hypothetical protein